VRLACLFKDVLLGILVGLDNRITIENSMTLNSFIDVFRAVEVVCLCKRRSNVEANFSRFK